MLEHEQINDKAVSMTIRGAKLTGRTLAKAMQAILRQIKKGRSSPKVGDQSIKRLTKTFGGVSDNIEVGERIKSFERIARKYKVSYHVERDKNANPPTHTVYFSGKQNGAVTAAFKEYTAMLLPRQKDKPSMLAKLHKLIAKSKAVEAPVKTRNRGGHEL